MDITWDRKISSHTALDEEDKTKFRGHVGKLRWVTDQTRADIAHEELIASIVQGRATYNDVRMINKMIQHVKGYNLRMKFDKLEGKTWFLTVFADASLKGLPDKTSSSLGYLIFLSNGFEPGRRSKCCILTWKSLKIKRTVVSTFEAECLAVAEALEEALVLKDQIMKITGVPKDMLLIECFCDCNDAVAAFYSSKQNQRGGRVQIDSAKIREMLERKEVENIQWISTDLQLADVLTKRGVAKSPLLNTLEEGKFFY